MAKLPVWNWKKETVGEVELPAAVFDYPYRRHLVWQAVKAYLAGRAPGHGTRRRSARKSPAPARSRSSRRGPGARGRAAGGLRSTATAASSHGPKPRSYAEGLSRRREEERPAGGALAEAARRSGIFIVDSMATRQPPHAGS